MKRESNHQELTVLVEKAKQSDADALAALCEVFYPKIYAYIYYRVGHPEDAEDLTSDVFVRMVESLPKQKRAFSPWLFRIASNLVADHYRKKSVRKETPLTEEVFQVADRSPLESERDLTREQLQKGLSQLREEQQQVIVLKFINDLDNREIAEILGKSVGAVKALQFRALSSLREIFAEDL